MSVSPPANLRNLTTSATATPTFALRSCIAANNIFSIFCACAAFPRFVPAVASTPYPIAHHHPLAPRLCSPVGTTKKKSLTFWIPATGRPAPAVLPNYGPLQPNTCRAAHQPSFDLFLVSIYPSLSRTLFDVVYFFNVPFPTTAIDTHRRCLTVGSCAQHLATGRS